MATNTLLILACGNPLRRDDGAGLQLAEQLASLWNVAGHAARLITVQQFTPELAIEIADTQVAVVLFVDTRAESDATDPDPQIEITPLAPDLASATLAHHLTPQVLLTYARELYHHAPPAWLVTIPGLDFGHGTACSPRVQMLLAQPAHVSNRLFPLLKQALTAHWARPKTP